MISMKTFINPSRTRTCEFCPAVVFSTDEATTKGWNWFTGRGDRTCNICPKCIPANHERFTDMAREVDVKLVW